MRTPKSTRIKRRLGLLGIFSLFLLALFGLGVLRYRSARLAYELSNLNASIQKYISEETALKQELSGLIAPIKIYSYCKERLGMSKVLKAEVLSVQPRANGSSYAARRPGEKKEGWRGSLAWLLGE